MLITSIIEFAAGTCVISFNLQQTYDSGSQTLLHTRITQGAWEIPSVQAAPTNEVRRLGQASGFF